MTTEAPCLLAHAGSGEMKSKYKYGRNQHSKYDINSYFNVNSGGEALVWIKFYVLDLIVILYTQGHILNQIVVAKTPN